MNVAVSGEVREENGRRVLAVDEVGIYIRDSYDFEDGETGYRSPSGCGLRRESKR